MPLHIAYPCIYIYIVSLILLSVLFSSKTQTVLKGKVTLPPNTKYPFLRDSNYNNVLVSLNGNQFRTTPNADGTFFIPGVRAGKYLLETHHPFLTFLPVMIDVIQEDDGTIKISPFLSNFNGHNMKPGAKLKYPLGLSPDNQINYFIDREEFRIGRIIKNPIFIAMSIFVALFYTSSKLQEGLDPEELRQMQGIGAEDEATEYKSPFMEYSNQKLESITT